MGAVHVSLNWNGESLWLLGVLGFHPNVDELSRFDFWHLGNHDIRRQSLDGEDHLFAHFVTGPLFVRWRRGGEIVVFVRKLANL